MELIFVYNENSDPLSRALGFAHKVLRPSTYKCALCNLTHAGLGERLMWKAFKVRSKIPLSFYYINEFEAKFNQKTNFPVILVKQNNSLTVLIDKTELEAMHDVEELINRLESKLGIEE